MIHTFLIWFIILVTLNKPIFIHAQHEDIPYEDVQDICQSCTCSTSQDTEKHYHYVLGCTMKNFHHILARWPKEFGEMHNSIEILATYSGNVIELLQQLPATNASLSFACRHCGIKDLQAAAFLDVPNIKRLDLSWNDIQNNALSPDVFRGPFRQTHYEPIALLELKLDHNKLNSLDRKLFEHTPYLKKLDLSYNKFRILDRPTSAALGSVTKLEVLNLCHNELSSIDSAMFATLINLKDLNLSNNELKTIPESFKFVGKSLEILNLAGNSVERYTESSFSELKLLKHLNISHNNALSRIDKNSLLELDALEYLDCSQNPQLQTFDLNELKHARNLNQIDISYSGIKNISLNLNETVSTSSSNNRIAAVLLWPKLLDFQIVGNPWQCDCTLLRILEFVGAHYDHRPEDEARCDAPYILSGVRISNLTADYLCSLRLPKKYRDFVEEEPPRFLRKRYIILTAITASVVVVLGLIIGFLIACIRKRLGKRNIGVEPVRYTSVRNSNLSAFSHVNSDSRNASSQS